MDPLSEPQAVRGHPRTAIRQGDTVIRHRQAPHRHLRIRAFVAALVGVALAALLGPGSCGCCRRRRPAAEHPGRHARRSRALPLALPAPGP